MKRDFSFQLFGTKLYLSNNVNQGKAFDPFIHVMEQHKTYLKSLVIAVTIALTTINIHAQYDHEFWFVAPDASSKHADGYPSRFVCTTTDFPAYVTIEMPKNNSFTMQEIYIPAGETRYFWFLTLAEQDNMENRYSTTYNTAIPGANNRAVRIRARSVPKAQDADDKSIVDINVYYDFMTGAITNSTKTYFSDGTIKTVTTGSQNNPDLFSLLGSNALGTEFYTVFQSDVDNKKLSGVATNIDAATSSFDIAITEDSTFIELTIPSGKYLYNPIGAAYTNTTIKLGPFMRGESYKGVPAKNYPVAESYSGFETFGRSKQDRLSGVRIKSNKKIAVTLSDDSMYAGSCYNMGGDQTIPTNIIGKMYFAQKGALTDALNLEKVYVTSIKNGTKIYVNGNLATTIDQGNSYAIKIDSMAFISSNEDFYAMQLTGTGCELGVAILPPIDTCTGSNQVGFTRPTSTSFHLLILCRTGAENNFKLTGEGNGSGGTINGSLFKPIPNNTDWKFAIIKDIPENPPAGSGPYVKTNIGSIISNSKDVFHLGIINGSAAGGTRYGYFSNFNAVSVSSFISESSSSTIRLCYGTSAQIIAEGGVFYQWKPTNFLSDPYSRKPVAYPPPGNYMYTATVTGYCNTIKTTSVNVIVSPKLTAELELDTTAGCDPLPVKIRNTSKGLAQYWLNYGDGKSLTVQYKEGSFLKNKPAIDTTITHSFVNTSLPDTFSQYTLTLRIENAQRCRDSVKKTITVFPKVEISSLTPQNSTGCDSLNVQFNQITKNAHFFQWDFGDLSTSSSSQPNHLYRNYLSTNQKFTTQLIATSKYFCADTAQTNMTVYPHILANFTLDTAKKCAPAEMIINNTSVGKNGAIKSYYWDFGNGKTSTQMNPGSAFYANTTGSELIYPIKLIVSNEGGAACAKSITRNIVIYPQVYAGFSMNKDSICSGDNLQFNAAGNLDLTVQHQWLFNDGSSSGISDPLHNFINYESNYKKYNIEHSVISSKYLCKANEVKYINVGPKLDAGFTINQSSACENANIVFTNGSQGGIKYYEFDFEGNGSVDSTLGVFSNFKKILQNNSSLAQTYLPKLTVYDDKHKCSDLEYKTISIFPKVKASFSYEKLSSCNPFILNLTNTSNEPIAKNYKWNFSDGTSMVSKDVKALQIYNSDSLDKTINVELIASSSDGCYDTSRRAFTIYSYVKADFTMDNYALCSGNSLKIGNISSPASKYNSWNWGDGKTIQDTSKIDLSHVFVNNTENNITRHIQLKTRNIHNCWDSIIKKIEIYPKVNASFTVNKLQGCNPLELKFKNNTPKPASKFIWKFSDGTSSYLNDSIITTFVNNSPLDSMFSARLIAISDQLCTDTFDITNIKVFANLNAQFTIDKSNLCYNEFSTISNNSSGGMKIYEWDFDGDGNPDKVFNNSSFPDFKQYFPQNTTLLAQKYYPSLSIYDANRNCSDKHIETITVYPKVTASFAPSNNIYQGCNPLQIILKNNSNKAANKYSWNISNGTSSNKTDSIKLVLQNLSSLDAYFTAKLVATSEFACSDTFVVDTFKVYPYIKADFSIDKQVLCSGEEVKIVNNAPLGAIHNSWNWGDGNSIPDMNRDPLKHTYLNNDTSTYTRHLSLKVKNNYQCFDSISRDITVYPAVDAKIGVDTFAGCTPFTVQFDNYSNKVAKKFFWNFGDGSSSVEKQLFHTYKNIQAQDKDYWVYLNAESPYKCQDKDSVKLTSYAYFKADFKIENAKLCPGTPLKISNASFGEIKTTLWDYDGKGNYVQDASLSLAHFYQNSDSLKKIVNLRLMIKNNHDCIDTTSKFITIYPRVIASFTPDTTGCNPLLVKFKNTSKKPATSFSWDFADGNSSKIREPFHTFINKDPFSKDYIVKLRAFSDDQCYHDTSKIVKVYSYIKADFKIEKAEICSDDSAIITDNTPPGVTIHKWDFNGDGIFSPGDTMKGKFAKIYYNSDPNSKIRVDQLTMVASNGQCFDTIKTPVTIFPKVVASFSAEPSKICNGEKVVFTNNTQGTIKSLNWDFGNGNTSNLPVNEVFYKHTSFADSIFKVKLTAISPYLCKSDSVYSIRVHSFIQADFKVPEAAVCSHELIKIFDVSIGAPGILKHTWDFDSDGKVDAENKPNEFAHTFYNFDPKTAIKKIKLTIYNKDLCESSISRSIQVYPKVTASFERDSAGCQPFTSKFNASSTKNATDYNWYFGTIGTTGLKNPTKTFSNYSTRDTFYNVKLVATSEFSCTDSVTKKVHVYHKPVARFELDKIEGCPPFTPIMTNYSKTTNSSYQWNFGDGKDTLVKNHYPFGHTFDIESERVVPKAYRISLKAVTDHLCTDTTSTEINVYPKVSLALDSVLPSCNPSNIQFSLKEHNVRDHLWEFGDGSTSSLKTPVHQYFNYNTETQTFPVKLLATSERGCTASAYRNVVIYAAPKVSFFVEPWEKRFPDAGFLMIDSTNKGPWKYTWDFGNGVKKELPQADTFTYVYPKWGRFNVKLLAENLEFNQCKDSLVQSIVLLAPRPIANFDSVINACIPATVNFKNKSVYGEKFSWDFDDGTSSSKLDPEHTFYEPGEYFVKLYVEAEGGKDSYFQKIQVYPRPQVDFNLEPKLVMLPDDNVRAFNATKNAVNYLWNFGDGTTSNQYSPFHEYKELGVYSVKLLAWNEYGCADSLEKLDYIEVFGKGKLVFPNAFTPSLTGATGGKYNPLSVDNDVFYPYNEGVKEYHLEIYNRWGELIFESNDVNTGWDGYYKNKLVKQDVYVYKAKAMFYNGKTIVKAGDVTLLHKNF